MTELAKIKCPCCNGAGISYRPEDNDAIGVCLLGNKYYCPLCQGDGIIYNNELKYNACVAFWKVHNREENKRKKQQKQTKLYNEKSATALLRNSHQKKRKY